MVVSHNMLAMNSSRQFNMIGGEYTNSIRKLSSGYRINYAADDAAGLSVSEKMRKQIRGLSRASENAEDGISLIQTAEGTLEEVHGILQRMNELAVQAANGTNSETDRSYIQNEVNQLKTEVDRIAVTAKFNDTYLLDGGLADPARAGKVEHDYTEHMEQADRGIFVTYLNGVEKGKSISVDEVSKIAGIKIIYQDITQYDSIVATSTPSQGPDAFHPNYQALRTVLETEIVPQAVNSLVQTFDNALSYLSGSDIGIGLNLYSDTSPTLASVALSIPNQTLPVTKLQYTLNVNIASLGLSGTSGTLSSASRQNLEVTIVHEMMHALMFESVTSGMTGFTGSGFNNNEVFPDWFIEGTAQAAAGGCYNGNDWVNGTLGIVPSTPIANITNIVTSNANKIGSGSSSSQYGTGYLAAMYLGYLAGGKSLNPSSIAQGLDYILSDLGRNMCFDDVIAKYTDFNDASDFQDHFGQGESAVFIHDLINATGLNGAGGLINGDYTVSDILKDQTLTGISLFALYPDNAQVLVDHGSDAMTGGTMTTGGTGTPSGAGRTPANPGAPTTPASPSGNWGSVAAVKSRGGLKLQIGADADNRMTIFIEAMNARNIGIHEVDVTTQDNATRAIDMVSFAIEQVSRQRSALGAYQNRLEHTVRNLDNVVENTTDAESRIRDTDMAEEMVTYTNRQLLMQAGQSMLAQANQANQGVLSLIA